ncbi:uncharacterized protein TRIADDRAFT_20303 [Trichoplax adhaerens]|uniref:Solute carrier organic anion transporter family member n=1 Tax=Trichoplax adhaerens TaxID=10228 RepID=B3RLK7_TRIAD|nr:hypothetical protein TRIADDRAFT_20303 [Trichoplax adhaerens]EDV28795.1 hypothetical protein TRIADDRAFT_20303 [Trichoplax adhaerens]|eukprot:XP_002107997.1 hypothetical protein TRIADDRAFT_20303 [Trichoplax adhaerens]
MYPKENKINRFGYGRFTPSWLQFFNHQHWLLFFICSFIVIAGMQATGFTGVIITSLEKRYELRSTETAFIASVYEISAAIVGTIVSFYACQGHKPKVLAYGAITMSLGAFIFALPHFISGEYYSKASNQNSGLCYRPELTNMTTSPSVTTDITTTDLLCSASSALRNFIYIILIGQVLVGAGNNLLWNVGMACMDENVSPNVSSIYIAIMMALSALGPAIGYLLGGAFMRIYVDWPVRSPGLIPEDARWVGAWWLGFIITGFLLLLIALPLLAYPPHLSGYEKYKAMRLARVDVKPTADHNYGNKLKDLPQATRDLITNKPFIWSVIAATLESIAANGFATFLPKFIEYQFALTSSVSSIITGLIVVPGAGGGMILGGYIVKRFGFNGATSAKFNTVLSVVGTIACTLFALSCPTAKFAGVNIAYPQLNVNNGDIRSVNETYLTSSCNNQCHCEKQKYQPVCGVNGITYFSPCHAGCVVVNMSLPISNRKYYNCSCIMTPSNYGNSTLPSAMKNTAIEGICDQECSNLAPFLILLFAMMVLTYIKAVPATEVIFRCVPDSQRSFALGIEWLFLRLLGSVPGPIIMGWIIDNSCHVWKIECGQKSSCWFYDNNLMRFLILGAGVFFKGIASIGYFMAWYTYSSNQDNVSDEENAMGQDKNLSIATNVTLSTTASDNIFSSAASAEFRLNYGSQKSRETII